MPRLALAALFSMPVCFFSMNQAIHYVLQKMSWALETKANFYRQNEFSKWESILIRLTNRYSCLKNVRNDFFLNGMNNALCSAIKSGADHKYAAHVKDLINGNDVLKGVQIQTSSGGAFSRFRSSSKA